MKRVIVASGLLLLCVTTAAQADLTIEYGDSYVIELLPNQANQEVQFFVSGPDAFVFMDLYMQIGDGGATIGGSDTMPIFQDVDFLTGSLFAGGSQNAATNAPLIWADLLATAGNAPVNGPGLIGTVTFDTTGMSEGAIQFLMSGVADSFDSMFSGESAITTIAPNGVIVIVPEPASIALLGLGGLLILRRRR